MRHKFLSSCLYFGLITIVCSSIGDAASAGANVVVAAQGNTTGSPASRAEKAATYKQVGIASWYGDRHQGRPTASGEKFDQNKLTAAHRTLPLDTMAHVTNLTNGRSVDVRVNDRGPYVHGRVIDLSARAAREIGMTRSGLALVRIEVVGGDERDFPRRVSDAETTLGVD